MANGTTAYLAAFASTDGTNVDVHYGKAGSFFVYRITGDGYDFVEERTVTPVCKGESHTQPDMERSTERLSDCRYVAASRIGSGAVASLTARGIIAMELPGTIEDAILSVWKYERVQRLFNQ